MEIKIAEYCGFCYGVKRAVEMAQKAADDKVKGGTLGPLIHNPQFIAELESKGPKVPPLTLSSAAFCAISTARFTP